MDLTNVSNQRRWTIVGLLFAASLINYLDRAAISFALPLISKDLHLTPATKGLLLSSFFWSYALMQVPRHEWKERDGCPYRVPTGIEAAPSTRPCRGS
jgi:MFS family permease